MYGRSLWIIFALVVCPFPMQAQLPDTVRVGSVTLFPPGEGTDTMDITFESRSAAGSVDKRASISVTSWIRTQLDGETVLVVRFGGNGENRFDFYLDPRTLATKRFEQVTAIDSAVVDFQGDCASGWVHMQNAPRRMLRCDRLAGQFASSPLDEHLVALLPLKAGISASLATYSPIGSTYGTFTFRVTAAQALQLGGRQIMTWRVERSVTTNYGTYSTTLWIDQAKHRIVQAKRDFGNGRTSIATIRNP